MLHNDNIDILRKVIFFKTLDEELLKNVYSLVREKRVLKNQKIYFEGDPASSFYFIISGDVKLSKFKEREEKMLKKGDIFAQNSLFNTHGIYKETAEVVDDAILGVIKNKDLESLLIKNPQIALKMLKSFAAKLLDY